MSGRRTVGDTSFFYFNLSRGSQGEVDLQIQSSNAHLRYGDDVNSFATSVPFHLTGTVCRTSSSQVLVIRPPLSRFQIYCYLARDENASRHILHQVAFSRVVAVGRCIVQEGAGAVEGVGMVLVPLRDVLVVSCNGEVL
jgi:hypothetical protein